MQKNCCEKEKNKEELCFASYYLFVISIKLLNNHCRSFDLSKSKFSDARDF